MNNELLLHIIATIEYRLEKSMKDSEFGFGDFKIGKECRTPCAILNHMHHVLKATRIFIQEERTDVKPCEILTLKGEMDRFKNEIIHIKEVVLNQEIPLEYTKKLVQGPFSDVLTHIGQLAMLQGLYGNPVPGEDFSKPVI